ncbi:HIT finger domain-containing protein [Macrophomina phaseolina]|uniref:HIT finger domain-containing protein n=1 Tax=Macrophomina phaseolina TaxID=35725 RepID=A0ABQ8G0G9_9PEZI|nr:HIT finger domain-containing protein [Macrophomina phaseolina]
MPHIEVIPITSGAAPAPGWAYVPDTGYDPSKAAINPSGRKRTARQDVGGTHDLSARQQTALHKRISELDRDTQKEVALPAKAKEGGSTPRERAGRKMTPAVRKILQSGRTFAHWLADEEALNAQRHTGGPCGHSSAVQAAAASPAPSPSVGPSGAQSSRSKKTLASRAKRSSSNAVLSSPATPSVQAVSSAINTAAPSPAAQPPVDVDLLDNPPAEEDILLRPVVPTLPPGQDIQVLLVHPPLPYGAARAAPPDAEGPPRRQFCEICGYWGRIKCLKCAARVCGLECKRAHDETSCLRI